MCGVVGYWKSPAYRDIQPDIDSALSRLRLRGPNDRGKIEYSGDWGKIELGHTRLSVIDLTNAGHQPMVSLDGRYTLVYNGEIYNYKELKDELVRMGCIFKTLSDTEVLLQAWSMWGNQSIEKLLGMFAFAIFDLKYLTLTIVRDAFGIKPLFITEATWGWCFCSELPTTVMLRNEGADLNLQRVYDYLVHGDYDTDERTFINHVEQVQPGSFQTFDLTSGKIKKSFWWKPSIKQREKISIDQAADELRDMFITNVRQHLRSDVKVGVALSGGIDSSALSCVIRHLEPDMDLNTFSYIAKNSQISEEPWVDIVNKHIKAQSHKVIVDSRELVSDIDDMIIAQGEPFGSTSIYAQYRVFKLARDSGITVTLEGQGADEILAGYQGYPAGRIKSLIEMGSISSAASFLYEWSKWPNRSLLFGVKSTIAKYLDGEIYQKIRNISEKKLEPKWLDCNMLRESGVQTLFPRMEYKEDCYGRNLIAELALSATQRGLPGLLRHADRNSMRFSIESRVPFLTYHLANYLFSLPEEYLISMKGETKYIFRKAMRGIVPNEILDRRDKIGFATPEKDWLLGLSSQIHKWINEDIQIEFLKQSVVSQSFEEMVTGKKPFSWQAWRWINFIRWYSIVFKPLT